MHKLKIDTHGNILIQYSSGEADPAHNTVVEGFTWLESEDALDTTMQYWNGSAWATKTERPNIWSVWASGAWAWASLSSSSSCSLLDAHRLF